MLDDDFDGDPWGECDYGEMLFEQAREDLAMGIIPGSHVQDLPADDNDATSDEDPFAA